MKKIAEIIFLSVVAIWVNGLPVTAVAGGDYAHVAGIIDTRTTFSDGKLSVEALARLAQARDVDVLFYNDHDILAMAYGLRPFRQVLRIKKQKNALRLSGPENYLDAITAAQQKYPELILVPGSESVPYYYWSGSYFDGDLTAHDHEKRLLTIGLDTPSDYEEMPVLHNRLSTRYLKPRLPALLFFSGALLLGVYIATWGRWYRWAGIGVAVLALLMLADTAPFRSSPYDQYMGDIGIAPYQLYIDYVNRRGGMTFWNYPETRSGVRQLGPIHVSTPPYPDALLAAQHYTGFAAVYGDTVTLTEPGREWDQVLNQFCRGSRRHPVWGIATADFHEDGGSGERLGNFPTVFWVKEKSRAGVLEAMRAGRMVAVRGPHPQRLVLDDFSVSGEDSDIQGTLGESIEVRGVPQIRLAMSLKEAGSGTVSVRIIRGGRLAAAFDAPLPFEKTVRDESCPRGEKTFYRLMAQGRGVGGLVANPVFITAK